MFFMVDKLPFGEGASINIPPLFCGVNYQFWKVIMKFFIQSTDKGIWEAIKNEPFIPQVKKMMCLLINLGLNGLRQIVRKPSLTGLQRI